MIFIGCGLPLVHLVMLRFQSTSYCWLSDVNIRLSVLIKSYEEIIKQRTTCLWECFWGRFLQLVQITFSVLINWTPVSWETDPSGSPRIIFFPDLNKTLQSSGVSIGFSSGQHDANWHCWTLFPTFSGTMLWCMLKLKVHTVRIHPSMFKPLLNIVQLAMR